jgi:pimeloyl-ACP methyl ester carboxylesterase
MLARMARPRVILLPGSVLPAELAYPALAAAVGDQADLRPKELEVYAADRPPSDYGLEHEAVGIERLAADLGWERFHLVGYSDGGAAALHFTATRPERVLSLALLEPAWTGNRDLEPREVALAQEYERIAALPDEEFMPAFVRSDLRAGVAPPPPPPGPPPPWMAKRPAGIRAFMAAFQREDIDPEQLLRFDRPVYFALGGLSNPDHYQAAATRLSRLFPDFRLELFEQRHHFDPPHRVEPERLAGSLLALWRRAERDD